MLTCKSGTGANLVDVCAHVACVVWHLGYARRLNKTVPARLDKLSIRDPDLPELFGESDINDETTG